VQLVGIKLQNCNKLDRLWHAFKTTKTIHDNMMQTKNMGSLATRINRNCVNHSVLCISMKHSTLGKLYTIFSPMCVPVCCCLSISNNSMSYFPILMFIILSVVELIQYELKNKSTDFQSVLNIVSGICKLTMCTLPHCYLQQIYPFIWRETCHFASSNSCLTAPGLLLNL